MGGGLTALYIRAPIIGLMLSLFSSLPSGLTLSPKTAIASSYILRWLHELEKDCNGH